MVTNNRFKYLFLIKILLKVNESLSLSFRFLTFLLHRYKNNIYYFFKLYKVSICFFLILNIAIIFLKQLMTVT